MASMGWRAKTLILKLLPVKYEPIVEALSMIAGRCLLV
jgi:hypothetical protein